MQIIPVFECKKCKNTTYFNISIDMVRIVDSNTAIKNDEALSNHIRNIIIEFIVNPRFYAENITCAICGSDDIGIYEEDFSIYNEIKSVPDSVWNDIKSKKEALK